MVAILEKYLHKNNYFRLTKADVKLQLISHPDYPSLKSITDTLDYFGIDNIAVNVPIESLGELPNSFLALLSHQENNSNTLVTKRRGKIVLQFEDGHLKTVSEEKFKEIWTGNIIAVEGAAEKRNVSIESSSVFIFLAVFGFLFLQIVSFNIPSFLLSLLSLAGLYLGYLIVSEEMGIHNKTVARVCRAVSKSSSCSEVIQAADSKLFGIALSDLCVVFFAAYLLTTSLLGC